MVLAHFIADYPLQTNKVYCAKISSFKGQLFHAGIHTIVFALFLIPYWHNPLTWCYLAWITGTHLTFDILKVKAIDKTNIHPVITYTADQVLHIAAASLIFWLPLSKEIPTASTSLLGAWYWNDTLIVYLIGLIVATYFTTYFLACWYWANKKLAHDDGYNLTTLQKIYGIVERGLVTTLIAFCGTTGLVLFPVLIALRLPIHQWLHSQGKPVKWLKSIPEIIFGSLMSVAAGMAIQTFVLAHN